MKKNLSCIFILIYLLTSCQHNITLEEIKGEDKNHNGIRDDVDLALRQKYQGKLYQEAQQNARAFQQMLIESYKSLKTQNATGLYESVNDFFSTKMCIHDDFDFGTMRDVGEFIEKETLNTSARRNIYQKADRLLSGASFNDEDTACHTKKQKI